MRCPTAPLGHSTHDTPSMVTVTLGTATTLPDDLRVIPSKKADGGRGLGAGRKVGTGGGGMGLGEGVRGGLGLDVGSKSGTGIGKGLGAGVGEGLMLDGKEAFGAPPPLPDTASYNTVIAAVASARGIDGRDEATALIDEMRVREEGREEGIFFGGGGGMWCNHVMHGRSPQDHRPSHP